MYVCIFDTYITTNVGCTAFFCRRAARAARQRSATSSATPVRPGDRATFSQQPCHCVSQVSAARTGASSVVARSETLTSGCRLVVRSKLLRFLAQVSGEVQVRARLAQPFVQAFLTSLSSFASRRYAAPKNFRCPITLNGNGIFPFLFHHVDGNVNDLPCDGNGMVYYFSCDGMEWCIIFRVMG